MDRMRAAESAEAARAEGIAIAREMVQRVRPMVAGVQLSAPFGRYQMAIEVAEAIGPRGIAQFQIFSQAATLEKHVATDLIEIDPERPGEPAIERAAAVIRRGGVVAIPTDALYTLVADPLNLHAVGRVFDAKGREKDRSLPLLVADLIMAEELVKEIPTRFYLLARHFWPGPLAIIAPASSRVPLKVTGNTGRLADAPIEIEGAPMRCWSA